MVNPVLVRTTGDRNCSYSKMASPMFFFCSSRTGDRVKPGRRARAEAAGKC